MKKIIAFFAAAIMALGLAACDINKGNIDNVDIDYGNSDIYSKADMDSAIKLIKDEFTDFNGCELHSISYSSDECNIEENINWMNDIAHGNYEFTECIMFVSDFHSPKNGGACWNPDYEYTNWQWWLARAENEEWNLMTWGYA